jgi:hypothetical protein
MRLYIFLLSAFLSFVSVKSQSFFPVAVEKDTLQLKTELHELLGY